jgi:hypothetical protein
VASDTKSRHDGARPDLSQGELQLVPAAQPGLFAQGAEPSRAALEAAQARLLQDRSLQFHLKLQAPTPKAETPEWLKWLANLVGQLGHLLSWVFWAAVVLGAAAIVLFILLEIARTRWPDLFKRKRKPRPSPVDWRPEAAVARALLAEADRLAAEGRYAEAARLLLHRSIEDIESRRPRLVRPAFTSREIAGLEGLPAAARLTFGFIAEIVERSLFGGREVDAANFAACRRAYEDFAFPGAWA